MCGSEDYLKCRLHFEYNLIESHDTVRKIREGQEYTLVHTKGGDEETHKKKIYLLGLNYDEWIFLRGNFRFRLLKGMAKFNGQVLKPSERYTNVRIPDFYPLFKLVALNGSHVKYENSRFVFFAKDSKRCSCNGSRGCSGFHVREVKGEGKGTNQGDAPQRGEEEKGTNTDITPSRSDFTDSKQNREPAESSSICTDKWEKNCCLNECSDRILQNYLYGLNMLRRENGKRKEFYEYVVNADRRDVSTLASAHMMDTISRDSFWDKCPIIIAFEKKKDFLYHLANENSGKKLNLSNLEQNNSPYVDTYQVSYVLREFLRYIRIGKKYRVGEMLARAGGEASGHDRVEEGKPLEESKPKEEAKPQEEGKPTEEATPQEEAKPQEESKPQEERSRDPPPNGGEHGKTELPELTTLTKSKCWEFYKRNKINRRIHQFDYPYYKRERETSNIFSIMMMGDKGKGKSLLTMNLINDLLNFHEEVYLVDIDVGQPIIGISGFLSIHKIKCPLNNYNFFEKKAKCVKEIFFGGCSIGENVQYYVQCLEYLYFYLFNTYFEKKKRKRRIASRMNEERCYPVVINTFGWVENIGLLLLNLNIYLSCCNFIVQIDSLKCEENVKSKLSRREFVSYLFNDFLLIKLARRNDIYAILNLNNEKVSLISEPHSLFNVISQYSHLKEYNFLFHKFDMSFEREKIMHDQFCLNRSGNNFKDRECEAHGGGVTKMDVNTGTQGSSDFRGDGHPRYSNKEVEDKEKQKRIENQSGTKSHEMHIASEEKYDYLKKKMKFFFGWNCVRVINFVSYENVLSHANIHEILHRSESCSIQAKRLRWFRIFCYFFCKFKSIVFYSYIPSFGSTLRERFRPLGGFADGHSKGNLRGSASAGQMKEQPTLHQQGGPLGDNAAIMYMDPLTGKELPPNDKPLEEVCHDKIKHTVSECEGKQTKERTKECATHICKAPQSNGPLFNCAIFSLKNVKLSSLIFNRHYFNALPHGYFNASRFFFNNVICLCKDVNVASSASRNKRKRGGNPGELVGRYQMGERREDHLEPNRVDYYIDRLYLNADFKNENPVIREEYLRENNVQIVPLRENFTCLLTAYVKLIDNMRLIIYLPFWFRQFDLLSTVDTFVAGMQIAPRYMDDMINEYLFYYDVVTQKGVEMKEAPQMGSPTEGGPPS
ncbi:unnamed protein product [Plasmodium vivax]|uniref:(malaria parasite P. vivax) hypothetical protein n=1 Tax=Plasmodium vivax TaxID=5855 RepID=A0A8S4HIE0_PLAVI|nr:unnamed protein product [Plasmodium vivax]